MINQSTSNTQQFGSQARSVIFLVCATKDNFICQTSLSLSLTGFLSLSTLSFLNLPKMAIRSIYPQTVSTRPCNFYSKIKFKLIEIFPCNFHETRLLHEIHKIKLVLQFFYHYILHMLLCGFDSRQEYLSTRLSSMYTDACYKEEHKTFICMNCLLHPLANTCDIFQDKTPFPLHRRCIKSTRTRRECGWQMQYNCHVKYAPCS